MAIYTVTVKLVDPQAAVYEHWGRPSGDCEIAALLKKVPCCSSPLPLAELHRPMKCLRINYKVLVTSLAPDRQPEWRCTPRRVGTCGPRSRCPARRTDGLTEQRLRGHMKVELVSVDATASESHVQARAYGGGRPLSLAAPCLVGRGIGCSVPTVTVISMPAR